MMPLKSLFAMGCITVLEIYALHKGIDGSILSVVVAALAGLGGYEIAKAKIKKSG